MNDRKENNTMNERIDALREFLMSEGYIKEQEELTYEVEDNCFSTSFGEYLVLTDDESEEKAREEIRQSLWAFNPDFILRHTKAYENTTEYEDEAIIEALREVQSRICENANELVYALIKDFDEFCEDAIGEDGRGHFLSWYDEKECESGDYYIYRI